MSLEKEVEKIVIAINGRKITDASDMMGHFASQLPPEAASLLASMNSSVQAQLPADLRAKISETSPDLRNILNQSDLQPQAVVRSRPEFLQQAIEQQKAVENIKSETDFNKKFTIFEPGVALGIVVGKTLRKDVIEIMREFSKYSPMGNDLLYFYNDISLSIFFDDNDESVSELKFGSDYRGKTSKGLGIGDTVEKAIEIYGAPRMKSPKGAIWDKFAIFCEKGLITSIRIQK